MVITVVLLLALFRLFFTTDSLCALKAPPADTPSFTSTLCLVIVDQIVFNTVVTIIRVIQIRLQENPPAPWEAPYDDSPQLTSALCRVTIDQGG
jgi:hypothetical protein